MNRVLQSLDELLEMRDPGLERPEPILTGIGRRRRPILTTIGRGRHRGVIRLGGAIEGLSHAADQARDPRAHLTCLGIVSPARAAAGSAGVPRRSSGG